MLHGFRHYWQLRRLQAARERIAAAHEARLRQARKEGKGQDTISAVTHDEMSKMYDIDDEILQIHSSYLIAQAGSYLLPIPEIKEGGRDWEKSSITGRWRLAPDALAALRSAVRKEQNERWEHWQTRLTLLIGLGGTLIGLLALFKK
jgi:hypothetical protein